jgi:hypothetical protein
MSEHDFEDQDYRAAEAPHGFEFGGTADEPVLNAVQTAESFPSDSMEAINGLVWLGYLADTFGLFGHSFTLRTLTRGDRLTVTLLTKEWEETLGMADAYQTAVVAAALVEVDGQPLTSVIPRANRQEQIRANFGMVQDWYEPVVEALFERVAQLNLRQQAAFTALQAKS